MHQTVCTCENPLCPADDARGFAFYVTVRDGPRWAPLMGPFPSHEDALACVDLARKLSEARDARSHWYAFGTAKRDASLRPLTPLFTMADALRAI